MAEHDKDRHEDAAAVTERNVAGMRELLAEKQRERQARNAEPPLEDDPHEPSQQDNLADAPSDSNGSTGGIRNMGGGRP